MLLKEVLLTLSYSILVEEALENLMRVFWLFSWYNDISFNWSQLSEMNSGRSQEATWEKEWIIKIKEMPQESSAHLPKKNIFLIMSYKRISLILKVE